MRLITFPVACYVLMTASAIIIHNYTKLQISCWCFFVFLQEYWSMMRSYLDTGGHCWLRWLNGPFSGVNRSNDDKLLYNLSCTVVLMACQGIFTTLWKIPQYLKDTAWKKKTVRFACFLFKILCQWCAKSDNCMYTAINIGLSVSTKNS